MSNLFVIGICFLAGILFGIWGKLPLDSHKSVNAFIISVSLPCLEFVALRKVQLDQNFLVISGMPWLLFGVSLVFFYILGKKFNWDARTKACLCLSAGLGNTSFLGVPIVELYFGKEGVPTAVVIDQLGTFLVLALPGTYLGTRALLLSDSSVKLNIRSIVWKLIKFPPFIAMWIALLSRPFVVPVELDLAITRLGDTLTPLALFSVGFQLPLLGPINSKEQNAENLSGETSSPLFWGLAYKLLLGPIFIWISFAGIYHFMSRVFSTNFSADQIREFKVLVLEAGMAPMITGSLLASEWGLRPRLAISLLGVGIPLSFISTLGLYYLLENFVGLERPL
ncbi:permease [Leptospira perolatii]|uniref:Permease n=1 Tax=Leptospira perolatii TaxID=2023191 RepID=A0A2M9ZL40_9LEPT|nr:AEC family transporter [Leptospira perolatii]PJZ69901.1 permease [Leptospira perolatii]PJZ72691.1 permease [Leptospira perolatii]